jgi:hypothetical protein
MHDRFAFARNTAQAPDVDACLAESFAQIGQCARVIFQKDNQISSHIVSPLNYTANLNVHFQYTTIVWASPELVDTRNVLAVH